MFRKIHLILRLLELCDYLSDVNLVLFVSEILLFGQVVPSTVPKVFLDGIEDRAGIIYWSRMTIMIQNVSLLLKDLLTNFEGLWRLFAVDLEHFLAGVRVIRHLPLLGVLSEIFNKDHLLLILQRCVLFHKSRVDLILLDIRFWIQEELAIWVFVGEFNLRTKIDFVHNFLIECTHFRLF